MFTKSRLALFALMVSVLTLLPLSASAVGKISATPTSSTLVPGQSVAVSFALDDPIICSSGTCDVTLDFAGAQTLGLTASPTSVNWNWDQWQEVRTITFTLDANTPATYPQAVVLRAVAQSNSEYYRGFAVSVTINLLVPDIRPVPAPVPSPEPEVLANTGQDLIAVGYISVLAILTGSALYFVSARRKQTQKFTQIASQWLR